VKPEYTVLAYAETFGGLRRVHGAIPRHAHTRREADALAYDMLARFDVVRVIHAPHDGRMRSNRYYTAETSHKPT